MDRSLLESPTPEVSVAEAEALVDALFGITGAVTPLDGERDRNFRILAADGGFALRIGNAADHPDAVEMQSLAMECALAEDPTLPIPRVIRTIDGEPVGRLTTSQGDHPVQLVTFIDGAAPGPAPSSPGFRRSVGAVVARLSRALRTFDHPALHRHLLWDLARLPDLSALTAYVGEDRRNLVERRLDIFEQRLAPALRTLPAQLVHGDAHAGNLIVDPDDPDRVTGLIDFGDATYGARVIDVAITASYQVFGAVSATEVIDALLQVTAAYHAIDPLDDTELALLADLAASRLLQSFLISSWRSAIHPDNADYILSDAVAAWEGVVALDALDVTEAVAELRSACGLSRPNRRPLDDAVAHRRQRLGPALSLSYEQPVRLESGDGVWLVDTDGRRLLDAYNNVPHVGHCHPQVTSAVAAQTRRLSTNTRYLVDEVGAYADRLVELLPGELSVVMFVNSGSEANDVAYQIARVVTGRRGVVITEHAYHGTTFATSMMSPEELGLAALEPWVAHVGGSGTLSDPDASTLVGDELGSAFAGLAERGEGPAMVIFDDVFSSDGIFTVPPGYLRAAYATARAAGALCVADEVQAGFGRVGSAFWGFAQDGAVPDIVTLGKPMGNGHPMGAVVTTPAIAAEFAANWHFFSPFAGSPVAAAAGTAVLDVLRRERLAERADEVGAHLRARLAGLAHPAIAAVRGPGLFVGVEMTDAAIAGAVVQGMRRAGVLIGRTGPGGNVLKIRPPLVFSTHHADLVVERLERVLLSGD
jgi:4-aminobutyrate aminotransferase-like enzyme/Ser/Thr protein kinase RdoA (MazF antagonist)